MEVLNRPMYHFHKNGICDEAWHVGSEITVDDDFDSHYGLILKYFDTAVNTVSQRRQTFDKVITGYLERDKEKKELVRLLEEASSIICQTNIFLREKALEEVRASSYPHLPSRLHSIWLTDKNGLEFWNEVLTNPKNDDPYQLTLFKVVCTGRLFKSSDYFLPDGATTYENKLWTSHMYWSPDYSRVRADRSEYLFQGKLKVLQKL